MAHRMTEKSDKLRKMSASLKYDVLSALAVAALSQKDRTRIDYFRLIALITSRYDWLRGEVSIGHSQLAELWSIDVRSVKRQIACYADAGLMKKSRAGVRGRVTVYEIDILKLIETTRPMFAKIGPDLEERLDQFYGAAVQSETAQDSAETKTLGEINRDPVGATSSNSALLRPANVDREDGHILSALRCALSPSVFERWFKDVTIHKVSSGAIEFLFPTKFTADYVERTFEKQLTMVVIECFGSQCRWKSRAADALSATGGLSSALKLSEVHAAQ
jgi:hypothetical protein